MNNSKNLIAKAKKFYLKKSFFEAKTCLLQALKNPQLNETLKMSLYILVSDVCYKINEFENAEKYLLKYLISSCKKIKEKKIKKIVVKDSRPIRDFGCAKDYVTYFHQLMQIKQPSDFVIASGNSYSVKQITDIYRKKFNLSANVINFKNELNFKNLFKTRRANNNKLMKTLKIRSTKKLPDVIDTMIIDLK